ncbi:hypothetical protein HAX54_014839 [Datura stramonium]|uniref:Pentatricopeptide repeat-containing protein n=1 Tax=Datura stramonium TaxID=4076 RepID=A0ABS8TRV0_DATST|nr:hypothetical protein [Datura stramonium]
MWELFSACRASGDTETAERVVERLVELKSDDPGYNVLASNVYATLGKWDQVRKIRQSLKARGLRGAQDVAGLRFVTEFIFLALNLEDGKISAIEEIKDLSFENNLKLQDWCSNRLQKRCKNIKDLYIWYASQGFVYRCLKAYELMLEDRRSLNRTKFSTAVEEGKQIHAYIVRTSHSNVFVGSALADMYSKCRNIKYAETTLSRMLNNNIISWTAMVVGYGQNGYSEDAVELSVCKRSRVEQMILHSEL